MSRPLLPLMIAAAALVLSGCSARNVAVSPSAVPASIQGLKADNSQLPRRIYRRAGSPALSQYQRFHLASIKVRDPRVAPALQAKVAQQLRQSLTHALTEHGFQLVGSNSANALALDVVLSDIKTPSAAANITAILAPVVLSVGEVTMTVEFRDSNSQQLNGVVVERLQGSYGLNDSPWSTEADVLNGLHNWANGFAQAVADAAKA
ncbi:DUF3313 family protein [uncultured Ferrimonas sp.]|uniref:DUF3313 family protein n=1 Tax=uncultured Ferrimonas sp. TaxID=432640 RepID=UPI00261D8E27|nr:DUF3313 family protein [uncultured Ferrimonas sp.]